MGLPYRFPPPLLQALHDPAAAGQPNRPLAFLASVPVRPGRSLPKPPPARHPEADSPQGSLRPPAPGRRPTEQPVLGDSAPPRGAWEAARQRPVAAPAQSPSGGATALQVGLGRGLHGEAAVRMAGEYAPVDSP